MTRKSTGTPKIDVYEKITSRIVMDLEQGVRPWTKPWSTGGGGGPVSRPLRATGDADAIRDPRQASGGGICWVATCSSDSLLVNSLISTIFSSSTLVAGVTIFWALDYFRAPTQFQ